MKTIAGIKKEMEFNKDLSVLIEALKSVAVGAYYALEKKLKFYREYVVAVESFMEYIDIESVDHIFVRPRGSGQAVIAITSDAGFLGGVNMRVMSAALAQAQQMPTTLIVVGERGKMYVDQSVRSVVSFPGIQEEGRFEQAMQMRDYICSHVLSGDYDTVKIVYPRPISFGVQRVEVLPCLPFRSLNVKFAGPEAMATTIMESLPVNIVEYLFQLWLGETLFEIFGLSRLAEFAARYFHLEESGEKLKEENGKIKLEYFRVRHELIDRSMRELFAGRFVHAR